MTARGGPCIINCANNQQAGMYSWHTGGAQAALCDGSVRFISENIGAPQIVRALLINDGFVVGEERVISKANRLFRNSKANGSMVYLYQECDLVWQKAEKNHVAVTLMPRQIAIIVWTFAASTPLNTVPLREASADAKAEDSPAAVPTDS